MNNKTVVIYANYAAPYAGNFISSQIELSIELKKRNLAIVYLLPSSASQYVWSKNLRSLGDVIYHDSTLSDRLKKIRFILSNYDVSFFHTHFVPILHIAEIKCLSKLKNMNVQIVQHFHNHYHLSNKYVEKIKKMISKNDYFISCSKDVYEDIISRNINNVSSYAENAIDFLRLDTYSTLDIIDDKYFNIMMFGFDFYRKGVDIALDAVSKLVKEKGKHVRLYIVLSTNKEYVIKEIDKRFGSTPEWVNILPSRNDIATYYRNMNLFISPSREEGFCYSIIEAAYCETFSVASDISGQRKDNMSELIWCKPNSSNSLFEKILSVVEMKEADRQKKLSILKKEAVDNYSLQVWVNKIIQLYKEWELL